MTKYVYGPVPSRRLGQSLGISPIPVKTCNYNCIYCQLGKTTNFTNNRESFFNPTNILAEISDAIRGERKIDYITFVGEGEPTLSKDLGFLIEETNKMTDLPIALITNGSLLSSKTVRREIAEVDVIIPTFDAGNSKLFRYINRPHKEILYDKIVQGLKSLRQEFNNEIWIEIMLLKDINDSIEILEELYAFLDKFQPNQVHINIPSRPPSESWVKIPTKDTLNLAKIILKSNQTLPLDEEGKFDARLFHTPTEALLSITKRHPLQFSQALEIVHQFNVENPEYFLEMMVTKKVIRVLEYRNKKFIYREIEDISM